MADLTDHYCIALDLLVARLRWAVPMVRWRAARALRDLLEDPATRPATERALLDELADCKTEHRTCEILTVFLCASPGARATETALLARLSAPSISAEILLRHICGRELDINWRSNHSGAAPADYEPTQYFEEFRTSHAPPRMSDNIFYFADRTDRPFFQQWAWEWERLTETSAAPHTRYPYHFDDFGEVRSGLQGHYQQTQADIYRSAYLRCFAFAVDQWAVPASGVAHYCAEFLPIAAGLFELDPVQRPGWLGNVPERCASGEISLKTAAEAILTSANSAGEKVLSMHIPFNPEIEPFGYLKLNSYFAETGFELGEITPQPPAELMATRQDLTFRGRLPTNSKDHGRVEGRSGYAVSTVSDLIPLPFGQWQGHYRLSGMPVPATVICGAEGSLSVEDNSLLVKDQRGLIAATRYWLDHWSPREPQGGASPCGVVCTVNDTRLGNALEATESQIFWVAQFCLWRREKDYEAYILREEWVGFWAPIRQAFGGDVACGFAEP